MDEEETGRIRQEESRRTAPAPGFSVLDYEIMVLQDALVPGRDRPKTGHAAFLQPRSSPGLVSRLRPSRFARCSGLLGISAVPVVSGLHGVAEHQRRRPGQPREADRREHSPFHCGNSSSSASRGSRKSQLNCEPPLPQSA